MINATSKDRPRGKGKTPNGGKGDRYAPYTTTNDTWTKGARGGNGNWNAQGKGGKGDKGGKKGQEEHVSPGVQALRAEVDRIGLTNTRIKQLIESGKFKGWSPEGKELCWKCCRARCNVNQQCPDGKSHKCPFVLPNGQMCGQVHNVFKHHTF